MAVREVRVKSSGLTARVGEQEITKNPHLYEEITTAQVVKKAVKSAPKKGN